MLLIPCTALFPGSTHNRSIQEANRQHDTPLLRAGSTNLLSSVLMRSSLSRNFQRRIIQRAHCTKLTPRVPLRPPSLSRQLSVARWGGVRGRQSFRGGRGHQSRLEVDRLVEKLIADEHNQREEAQLEVAEKGEKSHFRWHQCG